MALVKDDRLSRIGTSGGKEIVFKDNADDDRRAKGVVSLDENANQSGISTNPSYVVAGRFGVPNTYTRQTQTSEQFDIVKGALNKLRLRTDVLTEHVESSREIMDIVESTTAVGQFFKHSQTNINSIGITLQSAETFASIDAITAGGGENKAGTMEYSGNAALQAEYVLTGTNEAVRSAYTDNASVTQDGSYACKMDCSILSDEWRVTLTSTDLTSVTFSIKYANTKEWNKCKVYFFVGDGTNTKSFPMIITTKNIWQTFQFEEVAMAVEAEDDTGTTPDMTAITKMGFRVTDKENNQIAYADSITYQAEGGSIDLELWDFGTTLPTGDGTEDYTSDGTQYTEIGDRGIGGSVASSIRLGLDGGKKLYHVHNFIAGTAPEHPDNTLLTADNYYALVLKYVDTDVSVFGPNTTYSVSYYNNGYAWKVETGDNLIDKIQGAAGSGAYSDLMFQIFSAQNGYLTSLQLLTPNAPNGLAGVSVYIEDEDMKITDTITVYQEGGMGRTDFSFDLSARPVFVGFNYKVEAYYNDDSSDDVTKILMNMNYLYIPPTVNG